MDKKKCKCLVTLYSSCIPNNSFVDAKVKIILIFQLERGSVVLQSYLLEGTLHVKRDFNAVKPLA